MSPFTKDYLETKHYLSKRYGSVIAGYICFHGLSFWINQNILDPLSGIGVNLPANSNWF